MSRQTEDALSPDSVPLYRGKDGTIIRIHQSRVLAKVFSKKKTPAQIEREYAFMKVGYRLGVSPRPYKLLLATTPQESSRILMDELCGPTLLDVIERDKGVLGDKYQKQVVDILRLLDREQLFHGDSSPSNFVYDERDRRVYVIDYGMAKPITSGFLKKYGAHPNLRLGLAFFVLRIRERYPAFEPVLILRQIVSVMKLPVKEARK